MTSGAYDAIILAGGRGERLGGAGKPDVELGGRRLVEHALEAAAGASSVVVVGDVSVPEGVIVTREEPRFGGPAAGLVAGLRAVAHPAPWTLLLACDVPGAVTAAEELLSAATDGEADGYVLVGPDGRRQWVLGFYRTARLHAAADVLGDPQNRSLHALLEPLHLVPIVPHRALVDDVDTWDDHARWTERLRLSNGYDLPPTTGVNRTHYDEGGPS